MFVMLRVRNATMEVEGVIKARELLVAQLFFNKRKCIFDPKMDIINLKLVL